MRTFHKMFGKSMLASICIIAVLIIALFPAAVVGADSSESGFRISQWTGETWGEIYQHQFQVQYTTEAFTVDVVDGKVALRIVQVGTPFADVDQISLMVDGEELGPEYARYTESDQSIVEDILELDHNVVIAHEQEIEISWDVPAGNDSVTVYLTANEYGHGVPLHFPVTGYATYDMRSNAGSITVDGLITETDGTLPLYAPYWQPSSGHPDGYTYIYVCDDEEYVYFSLDVTGDNTNEYGEDWAEISILQPDGSEQAFRIDDYDNTWGMSGFGLTSKVTYKHQTYEFAIPKIIIGNENIAFNLAYYGTESEPYIVNPALNLAISINGDPSEGQLFSVDDTIDIVGSVTSNAYIAAQTSGIAEIYFELSIDGPSGSTSDDYYDSDSGAGYLQAYVYKHEISLSYTLTNAGLHTITLYSWAHVEGDTNAGSVNVSDDEEVTLDFYVLSVNGCASIANGSFEAGNYTGWTLSESLEPYYPSDPYAGTFGIAEDGQTISYGNSTYDYGDGVYVEQYSDNLPITYNATDGSYLAYILTNDSETLRMYQDLNLDALATNVTWDMWYKNASPEGFNPQRQYLAVYLRDTDDNILETLFKTTEGVDPYAINMTGFSFNVSAYAGSTVRFDVEESFWQDYNFDAAFDNFAITGGTDPFVNGSFEAGNYTGWTLLEFYTPIPDLGQGTFGIAEDGQTISYGNSTYDYSDGLNVTQYSGNLPITYNATDGSYLAYILTNYGETLRMYQDIALDALATNVTWDMWYRNTLPEGFDPQVQYLAVYLRDTNDNILETLFKTTEGVDPYTIDMTGFSFNLSAYAGSTVRFDIEESFWDENYFDAAFDNFAVTGGTDPFVNGSFETGDYTGWTLLEFSSPYPAPIDGTFGIAEDGQTINYGESTWDFHDGLNVTQSSVGLPITYHATDGDYLAYILVNNPETLRMYQDITLCPNATMLTWDMQYTNHAGDFDPDYQYLAVNIRNPSDDSILETLFKTTQGVDPVSIPMTRFSCDISAYAGTTVRLDITQSQYNFYFDSAFDNFAISAPIVGGKLFMVAGDNSTIYELDPSTGAVLSTIPTPIATDGGGDGLAYGGGRMFFTTIDTDIIYEIDPSTGDIINELGPEPKVAVYGADSASHTADVQAKLNSTGLFSQVDVFLVESDPVPTLAELQEYDAVLVYSNGQFGNTTAMGDVLANYVDGGGGAVVATFAFSDPAGSYGIGGRISSEGYLPFTQGGWSTGTNLTLVADEPEHPILSGVTSFNGGLSSYFNTVNLTSEAYLVAHWSNDVPLIAVQEPMMEGAGCVVGLNFFPLSSDVQWDSWDPSTDGDLLMANSLLFAAFNYEYEIDALGFSGDALYALEYGDNATIRVLDPDTGANITTLEPGIPLVGGLTFAGTRDSLFVSNNGGEETPSFNMTNKGFEFGDLTGWNVYTGGSGSALVETSWYSPNGTNYTAASGDWFALLQNGALNESTFISQNFTIDAGDIIQGWAFFSTGEDYGESEFNDECSVDIMDGATLVDRVFYADTYHPNWPDTPWTYWSWEAPSAGNYTLLARVVNIGDGDVPSYLGLDVAEEEPNTIYEIDAETGEVLNSFPAPGGSGYGLYGLGFSSARDTLFVGFYESNMIYEVDPDTGYVINSFAGPEGAAISALAADEFGGLVPAAPEADFHASNTTVCANVTIAFFDDSTGTYDSWYWEFGDGSNSTLQSPSYAYANAGNYTVSLTISGGYGEDTETKIDYITVLALPEGDFHASNTTVCANVTVDFVDDSTGSYDSWYWDFGDGSNSTLANPSHSYITAGSYNISLTVSSCCCHDTETRIDYITVLPLPAADFHASDTSPSVNVEIDFFDDSTGTYDSWYWDFGDGSNSTAQNPSHTYVIVGNYTVSLAISNGCGYDTETKVDYIEVAPVSEANTATVEAEADGSPLAVPVDWSWDWNGSTDTTPFDVEDIPDATELSLTAPATHTQNYTFYVFDHWSVGVTDYDRGDVDITFEVNEDLAAIAHYTAVITVDKTLDRCDNGLIGQPGYVVYDPNSLPFKTSIYFGMAITVEGLADGIQNIRVEDGIGADLVVTAISGGNYHYMEYPGKGKKSATKCVWELSDMNDGSSVFLGISVWTGTNPKGKQQYASAGEHTLNGGPKVFFTYDGEDYVLQGPSITVNVVR